MKKVFLTRSHKIAVVVTVSVLAVAVCASIFIGGGAAEMFYRNKTGLVSCSYSKGGDMLNSNYCVLLSKGDDGVVTLSVSSKADHSAEEITETYEVPTEALTALENVINSYKIPSWQKRRRSPIFALDAETVSLFLCYENGETITVSDTKLLPRNSGEAFGAIRDGMLAFAEN